MLVACGQRQLAAAVAREQGLRKQVQRLQGLPGLQEELQRQLAAAAAREQELQQQLQQLQEEARQASAREQEVAAKLERGQEAARKLVESEKERSTQRAADDRVTIDSLKEIAYRKQVSLAGMALLSAAAICSCTLTACLSVRTMPPTTL